MISSNRCVPTIAHTTLPIGYEWISETLDLVTQNAGSINELSLLQDRYLCDRYKSNKYHIVQWLYVLPIT